MNIALLVPLIVAELDLEAHADSIRRVLESMDPKLSDEVFARTAANLIVANNPELAIAELTISRAILGALRATQLSWFGRAWRWVRSWLG